MEVNRMEEDEYRFPERLKELRSKAKLSGRALSELIGLSKETISRYERGEREPGARAVLHLAKFFGVSTDYLIGE